MLEIGKGIDMNQSRREHSISVVVRSKDAGRGRDASA